MNDRTIAVHTAFACLLWPIGVVLVCVGLLTEHELGQLGILVAMVAAVLNVRGFFCRMSEREHNAFELGRDSAGYSGATPLRRP